MIVGIMLRIARKLHPTAASEEEAIHFQSNLDLQVLIDLFSLRKTAEVA
jgi:hypothetical protein